MKTGLLLLTSLALLGCQLLPQPEPPLPQQVSLMTTIVGGVILPHRERTRG